MIISLYFKGHMSDQWCSFKDALARKGQSHSTEKWRPHTHSTNLSVYRIINFKI